MLTRTNKSKIILTCTVTVLEAGPITPTIFFTFLWVGFGQNAVTLNVGGVRKKGDFTKGDIGDMNGLAVMPPPADDNECVGG